MPADEAPLPAIDEWKELLVIEPRTLGPGGANSASTAPWSFRHEFEWLAGSDARAPHFVRDWLEEWTRVTQVGEARAPVTPRPDAPGVLLGPWQALIESAPEKSGILPMEQAPFRLLAIVNRLDLAVAPCSGDAGQLRYVYAAVDPGTDRALELTLVIEVPYPRIRTPHEWAVAWHAAAHEQGEAYDAALQDLTRTIEEHVDPSKVRVRTNERAFAPDSGWELREFHLLGAGPDARLSQVVLAATPRDDVDPAALSRAALSKPHEWVESAVVLPTELQAGAASIPTPDFTWQLPGVDDPFARAFSRGTCNGCHGGETEALPFQHIAAGAAWTDPARVSAFLLDPRGGPDELARRAEAVRELLTADCAPEPSGYP